MTLARASLMAAKADVASSSQTRSCLPFVGEESIELSGSRIGAQLGMNLW